LRSSGWTQAGGGIAFLWNDLMGDHTVWSVVQANGTLKDIGGGVTYINRSDRLQWGASLSHMPYQSGAWNVSREPVQIGDQTFVATRIDQLLQRTFVDRASLNTAYPLTSNVRLEGDIGYTRYSYDFEIGTVRTVGRQVIERSQRNPDAPPGLDLVDASIGFVGDYFFQGFTGPIRGRRYRLEVGSQIGDLAYQTLLADYRQYLFAKPVTVAVRGLHCGRHGQNTDDSRLTPQFLGNGVLMRGYSFFSFDPLECGPQTQNCPVFDRLIGSRVAVASLEVCYPLLGTEQLSLINFPYLPTDLVGFVDGGVAWTESEDSVWEFARESSERIPVFSTGVSARVNVLGFAVLEIMYVSPFQRPDKGAHFEFQLSPGW